MDDLLSYGLEERSGVLEKNSNTRIAFKSIVDVISDISKFVSEQDEGAFKTLIRKLQNGLFDLLLRYSMKSGDAFTAGYESKIEELRERFRRAKGGLKDSILHGIWELALDNREFTNFRSVCHLSRSLQISKTI